MITKEELQHHAFKTNLSASHVEKDYVLSWILAGISQHESAGQSWIFKGGTCLRKIFIPHYRYSEDLDFTIPDKSLFSGDLLQKQIHTIADWVQQKAGIEIDQTRSAFESFKSPSGQHMIQGRLYYRGPLSPAAPRQWPRIKFDMTSDEVLVTPAESHGILHPYSDAQDLQTFSVLTYSLYDLFSEKMRALFERTRPRDLYDVVELIHRFPEIDKAFLKQCFLKKCAFKNLLKVDPKDLKVETCQAGWADQLSHQLEALPPFQTYLTQFLEFYADF
jgi:predicted nucleotidyltransferase component of viral defense system